MGCSNPAKPIKTYTTKSSTYPNSEIKQENPYNKNMPFIYTFRRDEKNQNRDFIIIQPLSNFGTESFEISLGFVIEKGTAACCIKNSLFFSGGKLISATKEIKEVCINFNNKSAIFQYHPDMLFSRYFHSLVGYEYTNDNYDLFAISGFSAKNSELYELTAECEKFDSHKNEWKQISPIPLKRENFAALLFEKILKIFVFGGADEFSRNISQIDIYDINYNKWDSINIKENEWQGRKNMGAIITPETENILIFGGAESDGSDTYLFKPNENINSKKLEKIQIRKTTIKTEPLCVENINSIIKYNGRIYCTGQRGRVFIYTICGMYWNETQMMY